MPYDSKAADSYFAAHGGGNAAAVAAAGVTPEAATTAINQEYQGGPPADTGMYAPQTEQGMVGAGNETSIPIHPAVSAFHLQPSRAAATADDTSTLSNIADRLTTDFTSPVIDAWKQVGQEAINYRQRVEQEYQAVHAGQPRPVEGPLDYLVPKADQAMGSLLFSMVRAGVMSIPSVIGVTGAANVAAESWGDVTQHIPGAHEENFVPFAGGVAPPKALTQAEAKAQAQRQFSRSLLGLTGQASVILRSEGVPPGAPQFDRLEGPPGSSPEPDTGLGSMYRDPVTGSWRVRHDITRPASEMPQDAEGTSYPTPEAAARAAAERNAASTDAFYVHTPNPDGTYSVQELGADSVAEPEAPPPVGADPVADAAYEAHAQAQTQHLEELEELVNQSLTQQRSPELMQEFIRSLSAAPRFAFVSPAALIDLWGQGDTTFTELEPEVQQAQANGTMVGIPLASYLSGVAGTPAADALRPHVTLSDVLPTPDQVAQHGSHMSAGGGGSTGAGGGSGGSAAPQPAASGTAQPHQPGTDLVPLGQAGNRGTYEEEHEWAKVPEATKDLVPPARAAVNRVIQNHYLTPMIKDGKALGMADSTLKAYASQLEKALQSVHDKMAAKLIRQAKKESGPGFKERLKQTTALTEQSFFARPDINAAFYLQYGQHPNGAPLDGPMKLDRAAAVAALGEARVAKLPQQIFAKPKARKRGGDTGNEPTMSEVIKGQAGVNTKRLAKMLGPQLYGDMRNIAEVTIKEVFQNSFDAVSKSMQDGDIGRGRIEITTNRSQRRIRFLDNGTGMSPDLLAGKFLQIAGSEKGENSAGGFGIAKMLFLYGNAELQVLTAKDGKLATLETTGPDLYEALEDESKQPNVKVNDWEEVPKSVRAYFPDGHGTLITLQIPQHYTDNQGHEKEVPFPYTIGDLQALINSPLFKDIEVVANGVELNIGERFPAEAFTQFVKIDEPNYEARVYVTREPGDVGYNGNVHVLSNGLWQFSEKMTKSPMDMWGDPLPYTIYIDMRPKVKPEDGGYPFNFNRQEFIPAVKEQFNQIRNHIQRVYGHKNLQSNAENYGHINYLQFTTGKGWGLSKPFDITPKIPVENKGLGKVLKEGDTVTIKDGVLYIGGEELPPLSISDLAAAVPSTDDLKVPQESISPQKFMVHDRVRVEGDKYGNQDDAGSMTEYASKKFGQQYFDFLHFIGLTLKTLRTFFAGLGDEYEDLENWALGLSFDPAYYGVNIKIPFSGIFINPFPHSFDDPDEQATELLMTMIHELAHYQQRNHSASFSNEFENLFAKILAAKWFGWAAFQNHFMERYREFSPMVEHIRSLYSEHRVEAVGKQFKDGSYSAKPDGGNAGLLAQLDPSFSTRDDSRSQSPGGHDARPLFSERDDGRGAGNGVDPELAAELFGYGSAREMLEALESLGKAVELSGFKDLKAYVKGMVKAQALNTTRSQTGFDPSPEGLEAMAQEAVGSTEIEDLLIAELRMIGQRPIDKDEVKRKAQELFLDERLSDGRRPSRYVVAAANGAKAAEKAFLKNDVITAFKAKQGQVIAQIQIRESFNLQRDYARQTKRWARWAKQTTLQSVEQEWLNWIHYVLHEMGYKVNRGEQELSNSLRGQTFQEFMASKIAHGVPVLLTDIPLDPSTMTVGDFKAVSAMLLSMVRQGQRERAAYLNGVKTTHAHAMLEVKKNADRSALDVDVQGLEAGDWENKLRRLRSDGTSLSLRVPQIILFMDLGDLNGPLQQLLNRPMQEAQSTKLQLLKEAQRQIDALVKKLPDNWEKGLHTTLPKRWYYAGEWIVRSKADLIRFALNLGNASNREKLLFGYGIVDPSDETRDPDADENAMWAFVHEHMMEADWDFVQGVWDIYQGLWPLIEELYLDVVGVAPTPIEATPIRTTSGRRLRGGYFPVIYNWNLARKNPKLKHKVPNHVNIDNPFGVEYPSALPPNHYIDRRKVYFAPIQLNFNTIFGALAGQIHDLAFRRALMDTNKVLYDSTFQAAVVKTLGPAYLDAFLSWTRYVAHESLLDEGFAGATARFLRGMRVNTAVVALGFKLSTAGLHGVQAYFNSLAEVDKLAFHRAGMDLYFSGPSATKQWVEFVWNRSKEIPIRMNTVDRDMATNFEQLLLHKGTAAWVKGFAFHIIGALDMATAMPTWLAAYRKFLPDYGPEVAAEMADETVRLAHGSGTTVNLTALQRGGHGPAGELGRFATMFTSVLSHNFNRSWYHSKVIMDLSGKGRGRGLIPGGPGGGGRLPPPPPTPDGWDDDEWQDDWQGDKRDWGKHLSWAVFVVILGTLWFDFYKNIMGVEKYKGWKGVVASGLHNTVGGYSLMNHFVDQIQGDYDDATASMFKTLIGTPQQPGDFYNAYHAIEGSVEKAMDPNHKHPEGWDHISPRWVRQAVATPGYFNGMSNDQFGQWAQSLVDMLSGKEHVNSIAQAISEIVKGEPKQPKARGHHLGSKLRKFSTH